jgi:hypothetical protein
MSTATAIANPNIALVTPFAQSFAFKKQVSQPSLHYRQKARHFAVEISP